MIVDIHTENPDRKFSVFERMASAIVELTQRNGGCLPQDLLSLGFTKDETAEQWRMATALATIELKMSKAK